MVLLCCEANCSEVDSLAVFGGGGVREGRGVAALETGTTEDGEADGMLRKSERKNKKTATDILRIVCKYLSETLSVSTHAVIVVPELESD